MMHTPGPWKIFDGWGSDSKKPIIVDSIPDVEGKCVANCICYLSTTNDDYRDNARLIAAAPEMLSEINNAIDMLDPEMERLAIVELRERLIQFLSKVTDAAQTSAREGS